jgi:hypothetical protein
VFEPSAFTCEAGKALKGVGGWRCRPTYYLLQHYFEAGDQLHAPTALPLCPLDNRWGEPQNRSQRREGDKLLLLPVLELRPLYQPALAGGLQGIM